MNCRCFRAYRRSFYVKATLKRCAAQEYSKKYGWGPAMPERDIDPDIKWFDCNKCKHKVTCLLKRRAEQTFEPA